ncbi:MAG: site-2 protease family protein [Oscillospiraceae bacterium]|nr:site-2 protease family protein [Oscillospiraceae bacterium]
MGNIITTLVIFAVIILIHEFGHFTAAKLSGVRVNEFSLGMGPALFRFGKGETTYCLRAFPIGGSVSMEGEDDSSDDARAFCNKKVGFRIIIVAAGAIMNLILGFCILCGVTASQEHLASNVVAQITEGSSIAATGLQPSDEILKINGHTIWVESDIVYELTRDVDGVVEMLVRRGDEKVTLDAVTFSFRDDALVLDFKVLAREKTLWSVLDYSFSKTVSIGRTVWLSFGDLLTGKASVHDLAGPIGMTQVVGEVRKIGWSSVFTLAAFITINVGIFNLLPIPALDGGRLVFLLLEVIRRGKRIDPDHEAYVHLAGFALVILLMIVVTFNDIVGLFKAAP